MRKALRFWQRFEDWYEIDNGQWTVDNKDRRFIDNCQFSIVHCRCATDHPRAAMKVKQHSVTTTGGRDATTRLIPGDFALAVGMPITAPPAGWKWLKLTDITKLESGHTPSRRHPEYWNGSIPWLCLTDARPNHGSVIDDTSEHTNALGIANSSARVLPKDTVCLSRTASVGYVVVMGREMATSQDFVNWVCSEKLNH